MKRRIRLGLTTGAVILAAIMVTASYSNGKFYPGSATPAGPSGYSLLKTTKLGGEGGWDYITFDSETRHLYICLLYTSRCV